ncbi:MAG: hypothetical protein IT313_04635 [Anaerolineales bacterium]|nr:hypothetical protein [Anaerolineales bacterium]
MKPQKLWAFLTLTIPTSILLVIHAYLGSFTRLIADDYCTMYNARTFGVFGTALLWYRTWTGVYARALINEILLWIGPYHMWIIVPGALLIWLVITTLAIQLLMETEIQPNNRVWVSLSLSMIFLFSILLLSPGLTQSLYWWGGLSAYTVPLILGTIYLILFLLITRREWDRRGIVIWSLISFLLAFGLGGISESFTPIMLVIILAAIGWRWFTKQLTPQRIAFWFLSSALIGASFALIFMISAPGNALRQANFPPPPGIVEIFQIATNGYVEFIGSLLTQPPISAGVLGVWLGAMAIGIHAENDRPPRVWTIPAALLFGMALAYLCFPPTAYGMSNVPPRRVLIISAFFLSVGLITSGYLAGKWSSHRMAGKSTVTAGVLLAVTLLLGYSSWITSRTLYENKRTFVEFANLWDQVDAQILQAKANGDESITIPAMSSWTGLDRPNENPKFWATDCYSDYYGIQVFGPPYGP